MAKPTGTISLDHEDLLHLYTVLSDPNVREAAEQSVPRSSTYQYSDIVNKVGVALDKCEGESA